MVALIFPNRNLLKGKINQNRDRIKKYKTDKLTGHRQVIDGRGSIAGPHPRKNFLQNANPRFSPSHHQAPLSIRSEIRP